MTTVAQTGIFGFGIQSGSGAKDQSVAVGNWYRHRATLIDMAVIDDVRLGPPEVGGEPVPTIPYKAGYMVGGGATIHPRLENSLGWLLLGTFGSVSTTGTGPYTHTFKYSTSNLVWTPFMGMRKLIPSDGQTGNYTLGETYNDCKIINLALTLPNDGLISARIDAIGRDFDMEQAPTWGVASGSLGDNQVQAWAQWADFEDYPSIPIGIVSTNYIDIDTSHGNFSAATPYLPVVAATVTFSNTPLDPRMERIYGSPYLDDVTVVTRAVSFDLTVKWKNPGLYRAILTGGSAGTTWTPTPFTTDIDILAQSPGDITGHTGTKYSVRIQCPKVMLAMQGGVQLAGNNAVLMRFSGTAIDTTSDYVTLKLVNDTANYNLPS